MNLLCRNAWGRLACLAILAVIVLAACSSGPGVAAPTVKDDAGKVLAPTLPLVEEGTESVSLSGVFTGASLEYSVESSDDAVATAAIANGTLTITAHKAGPATITVTAKNAGGSDKYEVKVTVTAKPPGDAGEVAAPTKTAGARTSVVFEAGDTTETIALSSVFTGESLAFTVTSNNPTVANATITNSNRSLTITARRPGSATITVTAENAGGDIAHSIRVTVPEPEEETTPDPPVTPTITNPSDCPSPLPRTGGKYKVTLEITRERSGKCTLPANHSLIYEETPPSVSVHGPGKGNVWTITALMKGRPVVQINNDKAGVTAGEITVRVPNTPPLLKTTSKGPQTQGGGLFANDNTGYITENVDPGMHFEDNDTDDQPAGGQGSFRFKVFDKPDGVLIDTDRGFVAVRLANDTGGFDRELTSAAVKMRAVILKNPNPGTDKTFDILLHAYDRANDVSDNPVRLRFTAQDPQSGMYSVVKNSDGSFKKVRIGNRIGVNHTIKFRDMDVPFDFVSGEVVEARLARRIPPGHTLATANDDDPCEPFTGPSTDWMDDVALGTGCFSAKPSKNDVRIIAIDPSTSTVTFQLDPEHRGLNETSGATITIAYHVVALRSIKPVTDPDVPVDATETGKIRTIAAFSEWKKTLSLDIHRCDDTTDCPLE